MGSLNPAIARARSDIMRLCLGFALILCCVLAQTSLIVPGYHYGGHDGYIGYGGCASFSYVPHGYSSSQYWHYPGYGESYQPSYRVGYTTYPSNEVGYGSYPGYGATYGSYSTHGIARASYPGYGVGYASYPDYGVGYASYPGYGVGYPSSPGYGEGYPRYTDFDNSRQRRGAEYVLKLLSSSSGVTNPFGGNAVGLALSPWYAYSTSAYQNYKHDAVKHSKNMYAPDRVFGSEGGGNCLLVYANQHRTDQLASIETVQRFFFGGRNRKIVLHLSTDQPHPPFQLRFVPSSTPDGRDQSTLEKLVDFMIGLRHSFSEAGPFTVRTVVACGH